MKQGCHAGTPAFFALQVSQVRPICAQRTLSYVRRNAVQRIDELRAMIGSSTLEELYVAVLGYWTILIIEQGKTLHPRTVEIWNAYAVKNEKPYLHAKRKES